MNTYEQKYNKALEWMRSIYPTMQGADKEDAEHFFPELHESEDERIRKEIIEYLNSKYEDPNAIRHDYVKWISWLEKQKEVKMIQWTGDNLKEVTNFTGISPEFSNWFKSWDEYKTYVKNHDNIFKMFSPDGISVDVYPGTWIVKTPEGFNIPLYNCWLKSKQTKQ